MFVVFVPCRRTLPFAPNQGPMTDLCFVSLILLHLPPYDMVVEAQSLENVFLSLRSFVSGDDLFDL